MNSCLVNNPGELFSDRQRLNPLQGRLFFFRLQSDTHLHIHFHEFFPGELAGVIHRVLPVHPADVRALIVNTAPLESGIVMHACAVSPIQKPGFSSHMHMLAAQTTLITRED
jgi:hypothetical protein